jgi:hypothetical protein
MGYILQSLMDYAALATQLDTSSMQPLPAILALRTTEPSYGRQARIYFALSATNAVARFYSALYFDMISSYLKGLWIETGEGINKEVSILSILIGPCADATIYHYQWVLQPGHLCQSSGLSSIVAAR